MILSDKNLDIWYKDYVKKFKNVTKFIERRGGTPNSVTPMSRMDFGIDFISMVYDNPNMNGKKIAETMAQQELYPNTYAQAKKQAEAEIAVLGGTVTAELINQYRMNTRNDIWQYIKTIRRDMRNKGFNNKAIELFVSQEVFGSP